MGSAVEGLMQRSKGRVMEGTELPHIFRRVMGGTERPQIFSKCNGRNGTLADFFGGCWEERNAFRFLRSDEWLLGRVVAAMLQRVVD